MSRSPDLGSDSDPRVTIVVTQRESFRSTKISLRSIQAVTPPPYSLIYVDGGSSGRIRRYLKSQATARGFTLIRTEHYLSPNEARNLALQHVRSKYAVFIDNDVIVAPGWLDALVDCAEESGAWVVGALYCIGRPVHETVHTAGGLARIAEENGKRVFLENHQCADIPLSEALTQLRRQETDTAEFHCMLVRRGAFDTIGPLDESLLSTPEHHDICLSVRAAGGAVYLEPRSVVTYLGPPPLSWSDLPFYALRWSTTWNRQSVAHFQQKWHLSTDDSNWEPHLWFLDFHRKLYYRKLGLQPLRALALVLFRRRGLAAFDAAIDRLATKLWVRPAERDRAQRRPPVVQFGR